MKSLSFLLLVLFSISPAGSGGNLSRYSTVRVHVGSPEGLRALQRRGIDIDHYRGSIGEGIELVLSSEAIVLLDGTGVQYAVLIPDMDEFHNNRLPPSQGDVVHSRLLMQGDGVEGFGFGSMGGFYTYTEVVRQLDSMYLMYPSLITPKIALGTSPEGRTIWGVEISDNPGVDEPGEATVYFDALHHAREPMSMAVMMYYMFWLLDNYGTHPEATYLVNNRRILCVPVVNPDGYVYNQTTNPGGGGNWRKNRSNNFDGSKGVDLNRNYGYQWGFDNIGSSDTPSSETYRGPSAWSESETRAVRDFVVARQPSVAFTLHSVAGRYLNPYGYKDTVVTYEYYAEFASDFSEANRYLYGTVFQMLDYNSNGTTRDFLHHDINCFAWTPEIGGSGFWPAQSEIIPLAQENLLSCKYITWVSGGFADYQSFRLIGREFALPGDTISIAVTVRNKGVRLPAQSVTATLTPISSGVTPVATTRDFGTIATGHYATNDTNPFIMVVPSSVSVPTELRFRSVVMQEGIVTSIDTFSVFTGYPRMLFHDSAESGITSWTRGGNGVPWDTTSVMRFRGQRSFADSRYGNVSNSTNNTLTLTPAVMLAGTTNPRLEYFARWSTERNSDYVRIQISTNNGSTWTSLSGRHTFTVASQPAYTGNKGTWAWEHINLTPYIGNQVRFRFNLVTNASLRGDGFYVDDFRIVDYVDSTLTSVSGPMEQLLQFSLDQNYPNPFNPVTRITFTLPSREYTTLTIFDVLGRNLGDVVGGTLPSGTHTHDIDGTHLASGVYFYRLVAGGWSGTRKMILLR